MIDVDVEENTRLPATPNRSPSNMLLSYLMVVGVK